MSRGIIINLARPMQFVSPCVITRDTLQACALDTSDMGVWVDWGSQQRGLKHPWGTSLQLWSGVFPRCHSSLLFIFAQSIGTKTEGPLPPCAKCIKPNYLANSSDVLNTWDVLLYILYETYTPDAQQFVCPLKYFVSLVVKLIITILASVGWKNLDLIDHYSFISLSSPEH